MNMTNNLGGKKRLISYKLSAKGSNFTMNIPDMILGTITM